MNAKQIKKIQSLLNKSLIALQDANELSEADWLLVKQIEIAKDAIHTAMATSESTFAITNA